MPSTMLVSAVVLAAFGSTLNAATGQDDSYIAVVTGDNVYVRSGAANSYYPFGRVNTGDLVRVTGEKFNWGRVVTSGPTFTSDRFFGYIIYPTTQPGRFRLSEDGKSGMTLGRADVLAPNLNTRFDPNDSWKPLIRLDAGTDVKVLETTTTANNTVHKIVLPENAEAWISMAFLRWATDAEIKQWEAWEKGPVEESSSEKVDRKPQVVQSPPAEPVRAEPDPKPQPKVEAVQVKAESDTEAKPATEAVAIEQPREEPQAEEPQEAEEAATGETAMPVLRNVQPEREAPPAAEKPEAEVPLAERLAEVTIDDLEEAYEQLRGDDLEQAEVGPLREMYLKFAKRIEGSDRAGAAFARARAEQLELLAEVQQRRVELQQIRARGRISAERAEAARLAVDAGGDYIAVGRLSSSTIYDGRRLPKMFRLQDPGTGRTVAYVEPDDGFDMAGMLDQLIGVIGEKTYDGGLRLNVLKPRRIDILAPR